jgi:hypothetical protein
MQLTEDPNSPVCNQMQFALIQNKIPKGKLFGDYFIELNSTISLQQNYSQDSHPPFSG